MKVYIENLTTIYTGELTQDRCKRSKDSQTGPNHYQTEAYLTRWLKKIFKIYLISRIFKTSLTCQFFHKLFFNLMLMFVSVGQIFKMNFEPVSLNRLS